MTTSKDIQQNDATKPGWARAATNVAGVLIYGSVSLAFAAVAGIAAYKFAEDYVDGEFNDPAGTTVVIGAVGAYAAGRRALQGSGLISAESQEYRRPHIFGG